MKCYRSSYIDVLTTWVLVQFLQPCLHLLRLHFEKMSRKCMKSSRHDIWNLFKKRLTNTSWFWWNRPSFDSRVRSISGYLKPFRIFLVWNETIDKLQFVIGLVRFSCLSMSWIFPEETTKWSIRKLVSRLFLLLRNT